MADILLFIGIPVAIFMALLVVRKIKTGRFVGPVPAKEAPPAEPPK